MFYLFSGFFLMVISVVLFERDIRYHCWENEGRRVVKA
jgi:hypothetical protein